VKNSHEGFQVQNHKYCNLIVCCQTNVYKSQSTETCTKG